MPAFYKIPSIPAVRNIALGVAGAACIGLAALAINHVGVHYDAVYVGNTIDHRYAVSIFDDRLHGNPMRRVILRALDLGSPQFVEASDTGRDGTYEAAMVYPSELDEVCEWSSTFPNGRLVSPWRILPCANRPELEKLLNSAVGSIATPEHAVKLD